MFGGMNPKQMAQLMKQMGIKNEDVPCARVVFEKKDGKKIVVDSPSVTLIEMQGQKSFQVVGEVMEEESGKTGEAEEVDDVALIMKETGCTRQEAEKALKECNGDLAEAIMKLKG